MSLRSAIVLGSVFLLGVGAVYPQAHAHGKKHNPMRYNYVMKHGMPSHYQDVTNPLKSTPENIARGAELYADNCASCHGPTGDGDGPAAKDLTPRPPALGGMVQMIMGMKRGGGMMGNRGRMMGRGGGMHGGNREAMMMSEGYIFWTISEGGTAMESPMPPFKDVLTEKERWQIIEFMSNGFKSK